MSARHIVLQAALVAVAIAPVAAQESPESSPAAPRQAVERARPRDDSGGSRAARAPERTAPERTAPQERSAPPDRLTSSEIRSRSRIETPAPAPATPAASFEQQGGRRRPSGGGGGGGSRGGSGGGGSRAGGGGSSRGDEGAARPRGGVRNPDADGGAPVARAIPRSQAPRGSGGWGNGYSSYGRRYYAGASGLGYYFYDPFSWYGGGWPAYGNWGGFYGGNWGGYYGNNWGGYGAGYPGGYGGYGAGYGYGGGGYGIYSGPTGWSIGGVRVKVDERDAEVYVDGYYAGVVDDFDGVWQKLRLDDGGYRLEIRKAGFEPLVVDVRVQPGRTITYRGTMHPAP